MRPFTIWLAGTVLLLFSAGCEGEPQKDPLLEARFTYGVKSGGIIYPASSIYPYDVVQFSDATLWEGADPLTYQWTFEAADPATSSEANPDVQFLGAGERKVTLLVSAGGKKSEYSTKVTVVTDSEISTGGPDQGKVGSTVAQKWFNIKFIRFGAASQHIAIGYTDGGWRGNVPPAMADLLDQNAATLTGGCYVDEAGNWLVTSTNNFWQNGLPADAVQWINNHSGNIRRFDTDGQGGYVIIGSGGHKVNSAAPGLATVFGLNAPRSFAFGNNLAWAAIFPFDYKTSDNCPAALKTALANFKAAGKEFLDIEIGGDDWAIVFR